MTKVVNAVLNEQLRRQLSEKEDVTKLDLIAFGTSIDFTPLFDAINKKLGTEVEFGTPEIWHRGGHGYGISIISNDIVDKIGLMRFTLKSVVLATFDSNLYLTEKEYCPRFSTWINFRYDHIRGGSNGSDFCYAVYTEKDGWKIEFVDEAK